MNLFIGCSSKNVDKKYLDACCNLVTEISDIDDINLVFGAYDAGIMGICYKAFKERGKKITGVSYKRYEEVAKNLELDELSIVPTFISTLEEIYNKSDIMLFLPGGIGTYAELIPSINEKIEKDDNKLLILYNYDFFYTPIINELYSLYENKFIGSNIGEYIKIESKKDEIIELIKKEVLK